MAIAFDAGSNGTFGTSVTSITWSHVCSGNFLVVFLNIFSGGAVTITATYDGVAMSPRGDFSPNYHGLTFVLTGPNSGTHNVIVSASVAINIQGMSASYSGVFGAGQPEATSTAVTASGALTINLTTITDQAWMVAGFTDSSATDWTSSSGATRRSNANTLYTMALFDTGAISPAGSTSITANCGSGTDKIALALALGATGPSAIGTPPLGWIGSWPTVPTPGY